MAVDKELLEILGADGVLLVGDKGMILSDYGKHVLLPEKEFADLKRPEPTIPRSPPARPSVRAG